MTSPLQPTVRPGRGADKARLAEILRVDHAGELGAVAIYQGQRAVFAALDKPPALATDLEEMAAHEAVHLAAFDKLLNERSARPTVLVPLWRLAGFALGAGTALLGEKAAHACTEAVESVIEQHYAGQIEELRPREPKLADALSTYRDDELGHRDQAVAGGAREAPGYALLSAVIGAGCRAAIRLAEKV
ncbi:demethoxyubiquinone hydroxylase family protein [Caulobacter sp. S45]|uniref:demethoxyubiquinone hydroxylase family protein n=1 Tax=Caulobacter sp. S45 TaxID=1641861 RepID=UPI001576D592|nr:demethoxyubiquinone hydroxylase family protein [Caulobacter sp. S45]